MYGNAGHARTSFAMKFFVSAITALPSRKERPATAERSSM